MTYRVAFASSDGIIVNQHFGRAQEFHIVEVDEEQYQFIETRKTMPLCNEFQHSEDSLIQTVSILSDCKIVFVQKIGFGALGGLTQNGIRAIEAQGEIVTLLEQLINSKFRLI